MSIAIVTGAPGWLGTALVKALATGAKLKTIETPPRKVRCLVRPGEDTASLRALGDNVQILPVDLRDREAVHAAVDGASTVFHSAGVIHPRKVRDFFEVNVGGTSNVVDAAARAGSRRLVHISSNSPAGLNADPQRLMTESDEPRPYMSYGRSKLEAERAVRDAHRSGKLETVILRPCWFYGPYQPERQTRFFRMIKGGRPVVVGSGTNLRSMSYIDSIVQAALLAEERSAAAGRTYWIADRRPYTFLEIVEAIAEVLGVRVKPLHFPAVTSPAARLADGFLQAVGLYNQELHVAGELGATIAVSIDAAARELGYEPEVELVEGMRRSITWCRDNGHDI